MTEQRASAESRVVYQLTLKNFLELTVKNVSDTETALGSLYLWTAVILIYQVRPL